MLDLGVGWRLLARRLLPFKSGSLTTAKVPPKTYTRKDGVFFFLVVLLVFQQLPCCVCAAHSLASLTLLPKITAQQT